MNLEQQIAALVAQARTETLHATSHRETGAILERLAGAVALAVLAWHGEEVRELKEVFCVELP